MSDRVIENRRAKLYLSLETIAAFLDLPEGLRLSHLYAKEDPAAVVVVVQGDDLDEVVPGCELPFLAGFSSTVEVATHDDGRRFHRFVWREAVPA